MYNLIIVITYSLILLQSVNQIIMTRKKTNYFSDRIKSVHDEYFIECQKICTEMNWDEFGYSMYKFIIFVMSKRYL